MTKKEVKPVIDIYKKFRLSREESQTQLETESIRSHILSVCYLTLLSDVNSLYSCFIADK
jgi:hypothetical protein